MKNNIFQNIDSLKLRISQKADITEEDVRQAINFDIKRYVKKKYNIDFSFSNEQYIKNRGNAAFRLDSKFGHLIIEYKRPSVRIGEKERNQLLTYLKSLNSQNCWGVLTNGKDMEIYQFEEKRGKFQLNEAISGELNDFQIEWICSIISKKDKVIINSFNINEILGVLNNKDIIQKIYEKLLGSDSSRTKLLYSEWKNLFNLSSEKDYGNIENKKEVRQYYYELLNQRIDTIEEEYQALFSIQTYYSINLKLLLLKLMVDKKGMKFKKKGQLIDFYKSIESNEKFREYNIVNLIDGDFFSWYLDDFDDEMFNYFYEKIKDISQVETNGLNLLMIHYYENIFPFYVRHAMGEFYTPSYLAEKVINQATLIFDNENNNVSSGILTSILDPCCGSGIFVINAKNKVGSGVNVYGIDINPIAVLTAKINYLLNFGLDLDDKFEIPIYLGDSTYFPMYEKIGNVDCYSYELITSIQNKKTLSFSFPIDIVNKDDFFQILDELEILIRQKSKEKIKNYLSSITEFHYESLKKQYENFIDNLIELENNNLNSIWLKIIGNYLKSASIKNIDIIIGNPPWVRWSNLPFNYRKKIKAKCRIDGLFSGDNNVGGVDLNICALICFISIRDRLSENGILGFLMPDSILFNKSFEGFRKGDLGGGKTFYLKKIERWNNLNERPFDSVSLLFAEYYYSFKKPIKIEVFDRKDKVTKVAIKLSKNNNNYSIISDYELSQIKKIIGTNKLKIRSGISLIKGGFYLLKYVGKGEKHGVSKFKYHENKNQRLQLSNNIIEIENDIVFPYVNAPMINDNTILKTDLFCIFPYPQNSKRPYDLKTIRKKYPNFYNFFMTSKIQAAINSSSKYNSRIQNNSFDVGIFRVGDYTWGNNFLILRDNTKAAFAKLDFLPIPWGGKKMPLFDGHVNFIDAIDYEKQYKKQFTAKIRNEIFNKFNKKGVKLYIKLSSDSRSISSRLFNNIRL